MDEVKLPLLLVLRIGGFLTLLKQGFRHPNQLKEAEELLNEIGEHMKDTEL